MRIKTMDDKLDDLTLHPDNTPPDLQSQHWLDNQQQSILNSLATVKDGMITHKQAQEKMATVKDKIFQIIVHIKASIVTHQDQVAVN